MYILIIDSFTGNFINCWSYWTRGRSVFSLVFSNFDSEPPSDYPVYNWVSSHQATTPQLPTQTSISDKKSESPTLEIKVTIRELGNKEKENFFWGEMSPKN